MTLWYLIWQWLQPQHTLQAVVADARRGGADSLTPKDRPLSECINSPATTAYSDARARLPLPWVCQAFTHLTSALLALHRQLQPKDLPVQLIDGSTKRLRPYGDIPKNFKPHRTRSRQAYWCLARIVATFCAQTGIATAARIACYTVSEQALAVQLFLQSTTPTLYIGDRNFGVWRVVRAAVQGGGHALMRLTAVRARRLLGQKALPNSLDLPLTWSATQHDQVDAGLRKAPVRGRLLIVRTHRRGYRPQTLCLFSTLTDVKAYPPERLLELYGWRWRAELNWRTVKSTLQMDQSECKSADMVRKEFYAGLMAYNLVRALMATAAAQSGCTAAELSFSKSHLLLAAVLKELFLASISVAERNRRLAWLLAETATAKLPRRRKPRPDEPRAQHHRPAVYPKLRCSRAQARQALQKCRLKS